MCPYNQVKGLVPDYSRYLISNMAPVNGFGLCQLLQFHMMPGHSSGDNLWQECFP